MSIRKFKPEYQRIADSESETKSRKVFPNFQRPISYWKYINTKCFGKTIEKLDKMQKTLK